MPRDKLSKQALLQSWIKNDDFVVMFDQMKCVVCDIIFKPHKKCDFERHINSQRHINNKSGYSKLNIDFNYELTKAFLASNIPLNKLSNPHLREFLEDFCHQKVQDPSTLRKKYVDQIYDQTVSNIRKEIRDNYIYIMFDETTDSCGRHIGNFLVGALKEESTKSHLLRIKALINTKHDTIVEFIDESLSFLWQDSTTTNANKVLILLSVGTPYMITSGRILKIKYPNLIHFTCLSHALNKVSEQVRTEYPHVNRLISSVKRIFLKSPMRIRRFREQFPNISLPPEPVIAQWDTWLDAAMYYEQHFSEIKYIVTSFDMEDSIYIAEAQSVLSEPSLKNQLEIIKNNYFIISSTIKKLEQSNLPHLTSFSLIKEVQCALNNPTDSNGLKIKNKLDYVIEKNPGFEIINDINDFLNGHLNDPPVDPELLKSFKYCPVITRDVEQSFSLYKQILNDRRLSFTMDTLEKTIVTFYENNYS